MRHLSCHYDAYARWPSWPARRSGRPNLADAEQRVAETRSLDAPVTSSPKREAGTPATTFALWRGFPLGTALLTKGIVRAVPHQMSRVRQPYREVGKADSGRRQRRVRQGDSRSFG